jgi:2-phosphosulfolactate phosphatase
MQFHFATTATCGAADDVVIVVDVIRAFTTAAYAFGQGAREVIPVATLDEAFDLHQKLVGSLVMGEVGGHKPDGFDFGNSPSELLHSNLANKRLIQRTSAGTQGIVASKSANVLLAASFVCATATAHYVRSLRPSRVTFVITDPRGGEDQACAEYLAQLILGETPEAQPYLEVVQKRGQALLATEYAMPVHAAQFSADLACCMALDAFAFAMCVRRENDMHIMRPLFSLW